MAVIAHQRLAAELLGSGALIPTTVSGVYLEGPGFIEVADAIGRVVRAAIGPAVERLRFGPVMARAEIERIGYFRNFPHLLGSVHCFCADELSHRRQLALHDAGEDWTGDHAPSDLVLIPAACYPVYPALALRGTVPAEGWTVQVEAPCFRREPSDDPVRMQSFRMIEIVRVGRPEQVLSFREEWLARAARLFSDWGVDHAIEAADDPFFGRTGAVMSRAQRAQELKFELTAPVSDANKPTACLSANYHLDKFGTALGLRLADGDVAHSACVGFGVERIVLALFQRHGLDRDGWPAAIRAALG